MKLLAPPSLHWLPDGLTDLRIFKHRLRDVSVKAGDISLCIVGLLLWREMPGEQLALWIGRYSIVQRAAAVRIGHAGN